MLVGYKCESEVWGVSLWTWDMSGRYESEMLVRPGLDMKHDCEELLCSRLHCIHVDVDTLYSLVPSDCWCLRSLIPSACYCVDPVLSHPQWLLMCSPFPVSSLAPVDVFTISSLIPRTCGCVHPFLSHLQCLLMCSPFPLSSPVPVDVFTFLCSSPVPVDVFTIFCLIPSGCWCVHHFLSHPQCLFMWSPFLGSFLVPVDVFTISWLIPSSCWCVHHFLSHPQCLLMWSPFLGSFLVPVDVFTISSLIPSACWYVHHFLSHPQCLLMCSPFSWSHAQCPLMSLPPYLSSAVLVDVFTLSSPVPSDQRGPRSPKWRCRTASTWVTPTASLDSSRLVVVLTRTTRSLHSRHWIPR